jgi:hypothetical protein
VNFLSLGHAAGDNLQARPDRQPIAFRALQFEADPVAAGTPLFFKIIGSPLDPHDNIHIPVVDISRRGEAARNAWNALVLVRLLTRVAERAVLLIQSLNFRFFVARA